MGGFQHRIAVHKSWLAVKWLSLVGTGCRTISHVISTNKHRNHSSLLVRAPFLVLYRPISGAFTGWRALTIESSPMSVCVQGCEPRE